jgi:hypothetical protein
MKKAPPLVAGPETFSEQNSHPEDSVSPSALQLPEFERLDSVVDRIVARLRKKRTGAAPGHQPPSITDPGST